MQPQKYINQFLERGPPFDNVVAVSSSIVLS